MKKEVIPYILIVVLVAVIAVGGTFIVMKAQIENQNSENNSTNDNNSNKDNESKQPDKTGVELVSTESVGSNVVQTFNAYMNNQIVSFKVNYEYYSNATLPAQYYGEKKGTFVQGKISNTEVYYQDTYGSTNLTKENLLDTNQIKQNFNENNFRIIKGIDGQDYLTVVTHMHENRTDFDLGRSDILYVFNDDLSIIKDGIEPDCEFDKGLIAISRDSGVQVKENPWYKNDFNLIDKSSQESWDNIRVKVNDDKIYHLAPVFKNGDPDQGTLEERVYTINNNKLSYQTINTYKITSSAGGIC